MKKTDEIFEIIVDRHYRYVYFYCLKKLDGREYDAKDCVQETFTCLYEKLDTINNPEKISSWLYRTADNFANRKIRRYKLEKAKHLFSLQETLEKMIPKEFDEYLSYQDNYNDLFEIEINVKKHTDKILSNLTSHEYLLWKLFFVEEKRQKHIVKILGISETAVKSRVMRLKIKLKRLILESLQNEELNK